jgi:Skp family chaperone for outer membrane proteins
MNTQKGNRTGLAGWLIAAVLAGMMLGSGFQDGKEKYGVVDLRRVIVESKIDKEISGKVEAARKARVAVFNFIRDHRVITEEQASKLRTLELKETRTDAENTELTELKAAIDNAGKDYERLNGIPTPTEAERQQLMSLSRTFQNSGDILQQYQQDFVNEIESLGLKAQQEAVELAAKAAAAVAKTKGYTVMFSSTAVVFAANDITADAIKEADK